ncbi:hypothetical protein MSIMFI_02940 [Mycobacterium simulans]|nr:hypothetical protein MSIMFI_02940 [Mycobacterium simulans]
MKTSELAAVAAVHSVDLDRWLSEFSAVIDQIAPDAGDHLLIRRNDATGELAYLRCYRRTGSCSWSFCHFGCQLFVEVIG